MYDEPTFHLGCVDGEHQVKFTKWDDDGAVGIDYMVSAFSSEQVSCLKKFWNRLLFSLTIFFKGEYALYSIYLKDEEAIQKLSEWLSKPILEEKVHLEIRTMGDE